MKNQNLRLTYIGGATALLEMSGLRLLTDPTFDSAGTQYPTGMYTLRKLDAPAIRADALGPIDAVLLSHDHHFNNLDHSGRALLSRAGTILTTLDGAQRLGGRSVGLAPWQSVELPAPNGVFLRVTATPARHGPAGGDRGPVIGFVLASSESPQDTVYLSGDTVQYEGVNEVARRFDIRTAILFMGAARVPEVGPENLTFTAHEAVDAARRFTKAIIIPLHYEGWAHFSESRPQIQEVFRAAGMEDRLRWMPAGRASDIVV